MRGLLLPSLPRLSAFYGLTPADVDEMTPREISEYLDQLAAHDKAEREASRGSR